MSIEELLNITITRKASDLHLLANYSPTLRINGDLVPLITFPALNSSDIEKVIFSILTPPQKELLVENKELDFSTVLNHDNSFSRFRVNTYFQKNTMAASFRLIPAIIPSIDELHLPSILTEFTKYKQGFVLLTGPSGQGKSTTLASLINIINQTRKAHIVTIEDPIEYVYPKGKSIISQREMYQDTHSWVAALRTILREDPDVVYIGEMRDYETVSSALTIAETGHLVFSTLHTNSAAQTIDRIIDMFPASVRDAVRQQLSMVISGVVAQRLVPTATSDRVPVCEIMIGNSSIRNIIREGKTHLIDNAIQTSGDIGMVLFEDSLNQLVQSGTVQWEVAQNYALRLDRFMQLSQR